MKVEFEIDESVYEVFSSFIVRDYGITLEEFLSRYLTTCVTFAAANPEEAIEIGSQFMSIEGFLPLWDRITRKKEDV